MIHVVTSDNRHLYRDQLEEQFRLRHDIYVGERKWEGLRRTDGLERDEFDTDDTIYHLAIENDRVVGGSRFIPTTKPHLFSEIFPSLILDSERHKGPDIYEHSRLFVKQEKRQEGVSRGGLADQMRCGMIEYCLEEGIGSLLILIEMMRIPRMHESGWRVRPLGLPTNIENGWWVAVSIPMDAITLQRTRSFCKIEAPVLVQDGWKPSRIRAA
jgi:acyl-homoserine lactone synthase